jgi:hypothetical protein
VRPLPLRPEPIPGEALSDFLKRLAYANGYQQWELWHILSKESGSHANILKSAIGYQLPPFSGPEVRGVNLPVKNYSLRNCDFTHRWPRWCPLCIDESEWLRPVWRIKVATVCHRHEVHLLQICPICKQTPKFSDILCGKCECGVIFSRIVVAATKWHVNLAAALAATLHGEATFKVGGQAVTFTTKQLVRLISYSGRLIEGPDLIRPGQIRHLEKLEVAAKIFNGAASLLFDWPNVFWDCLKNCVRNSPQDSSIQRVFFPLYRVIYVYLRGSAFQFLRNAFELFLLSHWQGELSGRHRSFQGGTINMHPRRSLSPLARANHIGSKTLKRIVDESDLLESKFKVPSKRHIMTIDKSILYNVIPHPNDYLDLKSTSLALGLKRSRIRQLVAGGVLVSEKRPNWMNSKRWLFKRNEVSQFVLKLRQVSENSSIQGESVTLNYALQYWRGMTDELCALLRAVKAREIPYYLSSDGLLRDIIFNKQILHTWLQKKRISEKNWVTGQAAARILKLKLEVLYELVDKGLIEAILVPKGGKTLKQIPQKSLDRFQAEFISLAELARKQKTSSNALLKRMNTAAVCGPKVDGCRQYFFRKTNLRIT